jgi:hypothetical protein
MTEDTNNVMVVRLDPTSMDDLAHRIADLVGPQLDPPPKQRRPGAAEENRLLTASQVAKRWGINRSWVYAHAEQLGVRRLGNGARPRLRFDPLLVDAYINPHHGQGTQPATGAANSARSRTGDVRRSPRIRRDCAEGLHIQGPSELLSTRTPDRPAASPRRPARRGRRGRHDETPAPASSAGRTARSATPSSAEPPRPRR